MTSPLLDELNAEQRAAAEAVRGPVCILAGAGSGKTRTITYRIAHQVGEGVAAPDEVLAVTFTDRAARELRARLHGLGLERPVRAATFHAAAWAQLRYFWDRAFPDRPRPEVLASKLSLLVPVAKRLRVEGRDLAAEIEWAKARRLTPATYAEGLAGRVPPLPAAQMAEVYAGYEREKVERGLVDYDDMITLTTTMLGQDPAIAEEVRERYRVFTVDEFQDVNPAQHALLEAWLGERDDLCVVGDDDQTIYSFTGASARFLRRFAERHPGARTVTLTENYRSTAQVLRLASSVLAPGRAGPPKRLRATVADGPEPVLAACEDDDDELARLVAGIRRLLAEGVPAGEIAVAYRINSQSEPVEAALSAAEIPYAVRGDEGFFARPEIRQALALLREAAGAPPRRDGPPPPEGTTPAAPRQADREVERVLREGLSWHPRREPSGGVARDRWRNLGALLDAAAREVRAEPATTLADLVAIFERRAADGQATADPDGAVTLLTLHKAKGLEFDAVFLLAVEEGLLPISHAKDDDEAIAEERRLLYVGVTRARRHLQLSWAAARPSRSGRMTNRRRSRFLDGLVDDAPARGRKRGGRGGASRGASPRLPGAANGAPPRDEALADALRDWRRERATRDGVPAYVVFPDRTLDELSRHRPTSAAELAAIPGLGPTRLERYGAELLEVLAG